MAFFRRSVLGATLLGLALAMQPPTDRLGMVRRLKMVRRAAVRQGKKLRISPEAGRMFTVGTGTHDFTVLSAALSPTSPDGHTVLTLGSDGTVKLFNAKSRQMLKSVHVFQKEDVSKGVNSILVPSRDGRQALACAGRVCKWWTLTKPSNRMLTATHTWTVVSAAFSSDGGRVLTVSGDDTAKVWNASTGQLLATRERSAAFSPCGGRVLTVSGHDTARVLDAITGQLLATLAVQTSWFNFAAFSPDGGRLVTVSQECMAEAFFTPGSVLHNTAKVWSASTGQLLATLAGQDLVRSAAFSPDGGRVLTVSGDDTAKVWSASTGQLLATLAGHDLVRSAAFSRDGGRVVTVSEEHGFSGSAKVWSASTGQLLADLAGLKFHGVRSAALSPDGRFALTINYDGLAKYWPLPKLPVGAA